MMKWRGQGILTAIVLAAAGAYAVQWHSVVKLRDSIEGHGLEITPYTQSVSEFVDRTYRWPSADEVHFASPPAGGLIRKVTLGEHGILHLTLSGWTLRGQITATFAPRIMTGAIVDPKSRLGYACVEVKPASLADVVCRQWGLSSLAEIEAGHAREFSEWQGEREHVEERQEAIAAAENTETECDRITQHADTITACVSRIDSELGSKLAATMNTQFRDRPRLRPEVIAGSPDFLDNYNKQCIDDWQQLAAQVTSTNKELADCLPKSF